MPGPKRAYRYGTVPAPIRSLDRQKTHLSDPALHRSLLQAQTGDREAIRGSDWRSSSAAAPTWVRPNKGPKITTGVTLVI